MRKLSGETKKLLAFLAGLFMVLVFVVVIVMTQQPPTITKTAEATLEIKPAPDFSLTLDPIALVSFTNRVATYAASVTSINDFVGEVVFSVTGLPPSITVTILPNATLTLAAGETRGVQIDIGIPADDALVGNYTIIVTAESSSYN